MVEVSHKARVRWANQGWRVGCDEYGGAGDFGRRRGVLLSACGSDSFAISRIRRNSGRNR